MSGKRTIIEEVLTDDIIEQRKLNIGQFMEVYVCEVVEASKRSLLTEQILRQLVERIIHFPVYHAILKLYQQQLQKQTEMEERRVHRLRDLQNDPQLDTKIIEYDKQMIRELDELVISQQREMEDLLIPGFYVTTDTTALETQQLIIGLIMEIEPDCVYYSEESDEKLCF